jgi:hypothetical protein
LTNSNYKKSTPVLFPRIPTTKNNYSFYPPK